jgi:hypothetical protein
MYMKVELLLLSPSYCAPSESPHAVMRSGCERTRKL